MEKLRKRLNAWNDGKGGPRKGDWMAAVTSLLAFVFLRERLDGSSCYRCDFDVVFLLFEGFQTYGDAVINV